MKAMRGVQEACIYQRHARCEKPPGTQTPVNSGNKKMIKSDLMSRCRKAKTHICHSKTDVTAPPSHTQPVTHSFITLPSLMFSPYLGLYHIASYIYTTLSPLSLQITGTLPSSCGFCFLSSDSHIKSVHYFNYGISIDHFHMKLNKAWTHCWETNMDTQSMWSSLWRFACMNTVFLKPLCCSLEIT